MGEPTPAPRKALGQHFLTDPGILRKIVAAAGVRAGERVLEIGPGPGGLTRALLGAGARVWAVETDERMVAALGAAALPDLRLRQADALAVDYRTLAEEAGGPFRLVANLPYNVSGPLLARLLRQRDAFTSLTVMLQREVAERLAAPPRTRTRGRLSVLAQCFCEVRVVLRVAPGSFRPPPKVESRVVRMDVRPGPPAALAEEEVLWEVVGRAFQRRRKTLRNALGGPAAEALGAEGLAGLGGKRPEELEVTEWIALANALAGEGKS